MNKKELKKPNKENNFYFGNLINKKRLFLVPHATLSIEAKNMQK